MGEKETRYLFGPVWDFLLLGGASLVLIPFTFYAPNAENFYTGLIVAYMLADVINHPHFAASYVLFYRTWKEKFSEEAYTKLFRLRYFFAGVIVPALLAAYFFFSIFFENMHMLGFAANAMFFLVGWHYTKQGYGILIVDSVVKKAFYPVKEKYLYLVNGFLFWLLTWSYANQVISEQQMWGVVYYTFAIPQQVIIFLAVVSGISTVVTIGFFVWRALVKRDTTAWIGVMAYLTSVYMWLIGLLSPFVLLFIPAFHSLQYLTVVYRFESNRIEKKVSGKKERSQALIQFIAVTGVLGFTGFWLLPGLLEGGNIRGGIEGIAVYAFAIWIFINIHHCFIDNVLWKKENKEIGEHLFS